MATADDLGDEWWLRTPKRTTKKLKENEKKKASDEDAEDAALLHSKERQVVELCAALRVTEKEVDSLIITADTFVSSDTGDDFNACLTQVTPGWAKWLARLSQPASPIVIVVSSSAVRGIQLNREGAEFRSGCTTAKLFAKHIKVPEQVGFLESHVVPFAIGTPNRISKLLELGVLKLKKCRLIVIDWYWRDKKMRRIMDIPEVKQDLTLLLKNTLLPWMQSHNMKLFLY